MTELDKQKDFDHTEEVHSSKIQNILPSKAIIDIFLMEQHDFLIKNLGMICRFCPEFQSLGRTIIDLVDRTIESIRVKDNNCLIVEISAPMDEQIVKSLLANGGKGEIYPGGRGGIKFSNKEKNIEIIIYKNN